MTQLGSRTPCVVDLELRELGWEVLVRVSGCDCWCIFRARAGEVCVVTGVGPRSYDIVIVVIFQARASALCRPGVGLRCAVLSRLLIVFQARASVLFRPGVGLRWGDIEIIICFPGSRQRLVSAWGGSEEQGYWDCWLFEMSDEIVSYLTSILG